MPPDGCVHGTGSMGDEAGSSEPTLRQVYVRPAHRCRTWAPSCAQITSFFEACGKPKAVLNKYGEELGEADTVKEVTATSHAQRPECPYMHVAR